MVNKLFGYFSARALAVARFIMLQKFQKTLLPQRLFISHLPVPRQIILTTLFRHA
jgi:hypothetical protein